MTPASVPVSGPDTYRMDSDPRGYVCILNYNSFKDRPDLHLEGSVVDVQNLANVFGKMGYKGHTFFSLTAKQTKEVLTSVKDMEILDEVGCAIFIISSHGNEKEEFLTHDMKHVTAEWVCSLFKDSECPRLKNKPKLFIFNIFNSYYKKETSADGIRAKHTRVTEPLRDMVCLYSDNGNMTWHSFTKAGTPFIRSLCHTLADHAHNKELADLFREFLREYSQNSPSAVPVLHNIGFTKRFFFNPISATGSV